MNCALHSFVDIRFYVKHGKHGNLGEFVNSGKLGECEMYSMNFVYQMLFFRDAFSNTQADV